MSVFDFDTGAPASLSYSMDRNAGIMDRVRDSLPADAPQSQIDAALVLYLKGWLADAQRADTIVRRGLDCIRIAEGIAQREPSLLADLIAEFAERVHRLG